MSIKKPIKIENLPKEDLFLGQVVEYLNREFPYEKYTLNIIQNYIKSEIISRPDKGRKRGYTRNHIIQLVLLSYMRPVLSAEEIKKVFSLAFNEINNNEDDIISWEEAYSVFLDIYEDNENLETNGEKISRILTSLNLPLEANERIGTFIEILILVTKASFIKAEVRKLVDKHSF